MQITDKIKLGSRLVLLTIAVGVFSGLAATALGILLRLVQHYAFAYSVGLVISPEDFLQGVQAASHWRRFIVVSSAGLIAAIGWWGLKRFGPRLVSIAEAVSPALLKMPTLATAFNNVLQIITVAMGSPLGREVAPRELAVLICSPWIKRAAISVDTQRVLISCAAGAGLAAIYNVPLGGVLFVMETLLVSYKLENILMALGSCAIATLVSWCGLGNTLQYHLPPLHIDASLCVWSAIIGPIMGALGWGFMRVSFSCRKRIVATRQMPIALCLNFLILGALAMALPAILGNGKSPVRLVFDGSVSLTLLISLAVLRMLFVWSSLKSGAQGGLLTPSLAVGALSGALLGKLWMLCWPNASFEGFAIVGACAFLAAAQNMPLTALVLILEFTHLRLSFIIPLMLAVAGAMTLRMLLESLFSNTSKKVTSA